MMFTVLTAFGGTTRADVSEHSFISYPGDTRQHRLPHYIPSPHHLSRHVQPQTYDFSAASEPRMSAEPLIIKRRLTVVCVAPQGPHLSHGTSWPLPWSALVSNCFPNTFHCRCSTDTAQGIGGSFRKILSRAGFASPGP